MKTNLITLVAGKTRIIGLLLFSGLACAEQELTKGEPVQDLRELLAENILEEFNCFTPLAKSKTTPQIQLMSSRPKDNKVGLGLVSMSENTLASNYLLKGTDRIWVINESPRNMETMGQALVLGPDMTLKIYKSINLWIDGKATSNFRCEQILLEN